MNKSDKATVKPSAESIPETIVIKSIEKSIAKHLNHGSVHNHLYQKNPGALTGKLIASNHSSYLSPFSINLSMNSLRRIQDTLFYSAILFSAILLSKPGPVGISRAAGLFRQYGGILLISSYGMASYLAYRQKSVIDGLDQQASAMILLENILTSTNGDAVKADVVKTGVNIVKYDASSLRNNGESQGKALSEALNIARQRNAGFVNFFTA